MKNASNSPPSEKVLTASGNNPEHKNIGRRVEGIDNEVFVPIMPIPLYEGMAEKGKALHSLDRYGVVG